MQTFRDFEFKFLSNTPAGLDCSAEGTACTDDDTCSSIAQNCQSSYLSGGPSDTVGVYYGVWSRSQDDIPASCKYTLPYLGAMVTEGAPCDTTTGTVEVRFAVYLLLFSAFCRVFENIFRSEFTRFLAAETRSACYFRFRTAVVQTRRRCCPS